MMQNIIDALYGLLGLDMPIIKTGIQIVMALIVLFFGFMIARILGGYIEKILEQRKIDPTVKPFVLSMINTLLKIVVLITVATMVGFEMASLAAIFGALVFAIGMALQGSLAHFASGVLILIFKPYKVGDKVGLGKFTGKVKEIQIFNTIIITSDGKSVIVPNGVVTKAAIVNHTKEGTIRVDMTFNVSYHEDIDQVRAIIKSVSDSCPYILTEKPIGIHVGNLDPSAMKFTVWPWAKASDYWKAYHFMQEHVKKQLDANNISIPFPQMDLHMINNEN